MNHNGKFKSLAKGVKKQQMEKKNSEIKIYDLDTEFSIIEKLRNSPKDSKPDNGSNRIFPSSLDVSKHSVNKNGESSNTDCGKGNIEDSNTPTAITKSDDIANATKVAAFIRKVLHNELPKEMMEFPLCLFIESNQPIKISQQEFQDMIIDKTAEVMATKSHYAKQMINISICKEEQRLYYKKYKHLLKYVNTMSAELDLLNRAPCATVKHVRSVGTNVNMPVNYNHAKKHKSVHHSY